MKDYPKALTYEQVECFKELVACLPGESGSVPVLKGFGNKLCRQSGEERGPLAGVASNVLPASSKCGPGINCK